VVQAGVGGRSAAVSKATTMMTMPMNTAHHPGSLVVTRKRGSDAHGVSTPNLRPFSHMDHASRVPWPAPRWHTPTRSTLSVEVQTPLITVQMFHTPDAFKFWVLGHKGIIQSVQKSRLGPTGPVSGACSWNRSKRNRITRFTNRAPGTHRRCVRHSNLVAPRVSRTYPNLWRGCVAIWTPPARYTMGVYTSRDCIRSSPTPWMPFVDWNPVANLSPHF
jgi:hypothetical protein